MSRGGFRGGSRGGSGGFRGGRGGGRGGFGGPQSFGPPDQVFEMGSFMHACEGEMVCRSTNSKIPYFNAPIYLENKSQIGKVEEILGPMNEVYFTVKLQDGVVAASFKAKDKVFIAGDKLLPLDRFLPKPKVAAPAGGVKKRGGAAGGGRGGARGASRGGMRGGRGGAAGGRGGFGGGRGAPRGGRGGFGGGRGAGGVRGGGGRGGRGRGF